MDYPIKYFIESILKKFLQDYFESDNLSLDSISLFGTQGVIRNLIMKPSKLNELLIKNDIGILVMSGMIDEINLEAFLMEKQLNLGINGVNLNLLLPYSKIEKLFTTKPKFYFEHNLTYQMNKNNQIFYFFQKLTNFVFNISNVNINFFIDFEDYLFQFNLHIYEINFTKNQNDLKNEMNSNDIEDKNFLMRKINTQSISFSMTTFKKNDREKLLFESEKDIQNFIKNKNLLQDQIINDLSFNLLLKAYEFRFDKSEFDFSNNLGNFVLNNIENFMSNTQIDLIINKFELTFNQKVLINLIKFFYLIEKIKNYTKERNERCKKKLRNCMEKIKNLTKEGKVFMGNQMIGNYRRLNQAKTEDDKFKEKLLNYLIYLFLHLIEMKYIQYNINHYLLMRLVYHYKKIIGQDFKILNYLIEKNIQSYLNKPQVDDIGSFLINLDYLDNNKNKIMNKSLKDFLLFLLNQFNQIKNLQNDFYSYDDFFMINFKLMNLKINLEKNLNHEENEEAIITNLSYLRNKFHTGENVERNIDFSNQLLILELDDLNLILYKNTNNDYLFLKLKINKIFLRDISYRKINVEKNYFPFLKIEHNINFNFFKIMNSINLIELDVPLIYSCLDPYCLFFLHIYYSKIKNELKEFKNSNENITSEKENKNNKIFLENIKNLKINILRVLVNLNYSKIKNDQNKSILLNMNKIMVDYFNVSQNIELHVEELIIGSIENENLNLFFNFRKNLIFNTKILNLFDIYQVVDYQTLYNEKFIKMPLPEIYIKLTKNDIHIMENYLFTFHILKKFTPNYKMMFDDLLNKNEKSNLLIDTDRRNSIRNHLNLGSNNFTQDESEDELNISHQRNLKNNKFFIGKYENVLIGSRRKIESEEEAFFIQFPILKFVIQIKLADDTKSTYKHIILVIDDIDFYFITGEKVKLFLVNLYKLNVIMRTHKSDRKLLEIVSKNNLQTLVRSDFIKHKRNEFKELETTFFYFGKENHQISIHSQIPPIYLGIDHLFIKFLIEFLKISNNRFVEDISNETTNLLIKLVNNNSYFRYYIHVNHDNNRRTIKKKITIKKITTKMKILISFLKAETFLNDSVFFSLSGSDFNINYDSTQENFEMKANLFYLRDDRLTSSNNKYIIYNLNPCIRLSVIYQMADDLNQMEIVIENAIGIFVMRSVLDIIEYVYFIFIRDIVDQFPSKIIYSKTPEELENLDEKDIYNLKLENREIYEKSKISKNENLKDSFSDNNSIEFIEKPNENLKKGNKQFFRRKGVGKYLNKEDYEYTIQEEKEKSPLKLKLLVKNGEILFAMNSAKKDKINIQEFDFSNKKEKLVLAFSEIEYVNFIESETIKNYYHNYINSRKSKILFSEKTFDMNNIEMSVKVKDARFYVNPIIQTEIDFAWFYNKDEKSDIENNINNLDQNSNFIGSFTFLFEITKEFFSNCKIYLLIPYIRLRLFTDNYEKILRLCFENLMEEQEVLADCSIFAKEFYKKYNVIKPYLEFGILFDDFGIYQYNFPSNCLLHKSEKLTKIPKVHSQFSDCKFGKINPPIELDKMCTIKANNFYIMLRFFCNYEKNIYIESDSFSCELNKYLRAFSKLNTFDLFRTINRNGDNTGTFYNNENKKNEINLLNKPVNIDIFILKNDVKNYTVNLNNFKFNYISSPFIALYRFFTKYFFYYQNKNIKIVDHDESPSKIIQLKMREVELILQSNYMESNNSFYEVDVKLDFEMYMKTLGNTSLGPITDFKQFGIFIKSIYLNEFKAKKYGKVNPNTYSQPSHIISNSINNVNFNPNINTYRNQILDNADFDIEMYTRADDKLQTNNRFFYQFCKIRGNDYFDKILLFNEKNSEFIENSSYNVHNISLSSHKENLEHNYENINIKKQNPYEFKKFINNLKFREKDVIDFSKNKKTDLDEKSKIILNFPEFPRTSETKPNLEKFNKKIKLSLSLNQILQMKKIFDDINKDSTENSKNILYAYSDKTSFDVITYNTNYGFSINEIEIVLSDSQFNSVLFQFKILNLFCFITNKPECKKLMEAVENINLNYNNIESKDETRNRNSNLNEDINITQENQIIENENIKNKFNYDLLAKFLLRINYHNNTSSKWEPFIEPLPTMIAYFKNEVQEYFVIDLLSLEQISVGIENVCRQREFHSLNININEILLENIRNLNLDYNKISNKKDSRIVNYDYNKKLVIKNLTEYKMNVLNLRDFYEFKEIPEDNISILEYKKDQQMINRENLKILFKNSQFVEEVNLNTSPKRNYIINTLNEENSALIEESYKGETNNLNLRNSTNKNESILEINTEKTSKIYTILKNENLSKLSNSKKVEMDELRKNFDEKNSILIPGEQFLVTEIDLNLKMNIKSVTFRSNEGIKNDLDFPVKIKFILKDGTPNLIANYYENAVVIEPRFVYFIPPILLDKVKLIEIKPIFPNNDIIEFHSGVYPIDQMDLSTDEQNFTVVYCKIKNFNATELDKNLYLQNVAFAVVKKFEVAEGDCLDNNIKKRIEWIKSYSKFRGNEYDSENKKRLEKILCDVTYVLTPVVRFYNSLPRDITVKKMLPDDILNNYNKCKGGLEEINHFDIENFIKKYSIRYFNELKKKEENFMSPQDYFVSFNKAKYSNFQERKNLNVNESEDESVSQISEDSKLQEINIENVNNLNEINQNENYYYDNNNQIYSGILIKANGDYLSIYEPYLLQEKFAKYLSYKIRIEDFTKSKESGRKLALANDRHNSSKSSVIRKSSVRSIKDEEHPSQKDTSINSEFIIKPFNFKRILKMYKNNSEYERFNKPGKYLIFNLDTSNLKTETNSYKNSIKKSNNKEILLHTYEITQNYVMNTHLYCPYLFINSSDLDLLISYKKIFESFLTNETRDKNFYNKKDNDNYIDYLKRITMFYPEDIKNFKFYICNKSIKQRKQIKILDIASTGKVVEINIKNKNKNKNMIATKSEIRYFRTDTNLIEEYDEYTKMYKKNQNINLNPRVLQVERQDKRVMISMQMEVLNNVLKWSKLIFITPSVYIFNTTKRDIYIYHFNKNNKGPNKYEVIRSKKTIKFYYLVNFYEFIKISYEDKLNPDDFKLYSGLIRLIGNNEFYVTLSEREGLKTLLFIKVYKVYGFLYVVIKHKESVTDYPYFIVNNLNRNIKYKQKEFLDEEMKDFFKFSNIKMNIQTMELPGINQESDGNKMNQENEIMTEIEIPINNNYYTWDEPFMRNKNDRNILEIIFFGSKFEINPDDIHEETKFFDRAKFSEDNMLYINDIPIKGTLSVKDGIKSREFSYSLYEYALYISDQQGRQTKFEFHDKDLGIYRKSNGKIVLKKNKEYEMHCISDEETNLLAGRIYKSIEKAREFVNNIIIKKYVKNKSIYVEITNKSTQSKIKPKKMRTMFICNIQNIGISLIQKNYEFMYIWFKEVNLGLQKSNQKLKKLLLNIKDYQIDHYLNNSYYPIVLSPLSDSTLDLNENYKNVAIEITNLKFSNNFYQLDSFYVSLQSVDLRLEYKIIEKVYNFIQTANRIFSVIPENGTKKEIRQIIKEIDECNYVDEKVVMSYENFLLIKQIMISDVKISFSLKFENIDMFLEKTSFLFLKPLIEELGLKIMNMDTAMFNFIPFIRNNIYQSTDEFMNIISMFFYNQFVSELVKNLGGLSSITSLQLVENLNNNILSNMRMEKNAVTRMTKKTNNIKDLYKTGFENVTLIVGGLFMLAFKMMSVFGKFLAYLTIDEIFQQRRSYKMNKSVRSLWDGVGSAFKILFFALIYTFTQLYYVPVRMYSKYKIYGIFYALLIIILGIILKPIIGFTDLTTKILESISFSINDVFGDRVKKLARYQRNIKDNELTDYNPIDALAYTVYKYMDIDSINTTFEDIQLAIPGIKKDKRVLLLFTSDRIIVVDYDDYRFVPKYQIHFSECKLFNNSTMPKQIAPHLSIIGKRLGFLTNDKGERYLYIYFDAVRKRWFNCSKKSFELRIKLFEFEENSIIAEKYNAMIENIFKKYSDLDNK